MNKILMPKEKLVFKIKFSTRIFFIDLLFLLAIISFAVNQGRGSFISLILLIIFIPLFIKTIKDFYRIFFHKVYITNFRVIYQKHFLFKKPKSYPLKRINGVFFKSNILDRAKNMTTFKLTLTDNTFFILKNIKAGNVVAELLSANIKKENKKSLKLRKKKL